MKIKAKDTIAIVVDYQERLMPVMYEKEALLKNTAILLNGLKELGVPIAVTQQYTKGLGETVNEITTAAGTEEYVEKISFSAYEGVKEKIRDKKYIIICGIETHICVLQTVIDLKAAGFIPVIVENCVSSRKENDKKIALQRMKEEGAIITTYESVLFELLKEAGTEKSKKIQRLIK